MPSVRMIVLLGCFFNEFGVVAASGFCAVASADEDEAFNVSILDGFDDFACYA